MIESIYAAPKFVDLQQAVDFAVSQQIHYEVPVFMSPELLEKQDEELIKYQQMFSGLQGKMSVHGPVFDTNPVSMDPCINKCSRTRYRQAIQAAKELGAKYIVFHSQYSPVYKVANVYQDWLAGSIDYWGQIVADELEGSDLTILMENFMDDRPDILVDMAEGVDSPNFKVCLDTGHANLFSQVSAVDWVDTMSSHLDYIHAHNNHGELDDHNGFLDGNIDMDGFLNHLVLLPRKINLALEIFNMEALESSYHMLKPYMRVQEEYNESRSFLV
ncbi:MAG: sugar phosphate isomerase/epimerase [Vampirovibrio sp.]|nr:sugar phosphate isomerase/epimerase [Vampirovibrio sp.]